MRATEILRAVADGRAEWRWAALPHDSGVSVMEDALRVDGVRVAVSARTAQIVADALGARLSTPQLEDAIYRCAGDRVHPRPMDVVRATALDWSRQIDDLRTFGGTGRIVATVGKAWVESSLARPDRAANYGFHTPTGGYPPATPGGCRVWQPESNAHNLDHVDYSQTLRLVRCPGAAWRQPGVARVPPLPTDASMGEWAAWWSLVMAADEERPRAETIAAWLRGCVRRGQPLEVTTGNHCAAAASAAGVLAELATGASAPHQPRAAAREIMIDAQASGAWRAAGAWRAGTWLPAVGDLAIYDRSVEGRPETSWWGHVDRVVAIIDGAAVETCGANEGPRGEWRREVLRSDHPRLLGCVEYPRPHYHPPMGSAAVAEQDAGLSPVAIASMYRSMAEGAAELREHGWAARDA